LAAEIDDAAGANHDQSGPLERYSNRYDLQDRLSAAVTRMEKARASN
jgi:hypothetical protein